jgi:hypothetical protein
MDGNHRSELRLARGLVVPCDRTSSSCDHRAARLRAMYGSSHTRCVPAIDEAPVACPRDDTSHTPAETRRRPVRAGDGNSHTPPARHAHASPCPRDSSRMSCPGEPRRDGARGNSCRSRVRKVQSSLRRRGRSRKRWAASAARAVPRCGSWCTSRDRRERPLRSACGSSRRFARAWLARVRPTCGSPRTSRGPWSRRSRFFRDGTSRRALQRAAALRRAVDDNRGTAPSRDEACRGTSRTRPPFVRPRARAVDGTRRRRPPHLPWRPVVDV